MAIHCVYFLWKAGRGLGATADGEWVWESWWLRDTPLVNEIEQVFSFCSESRDMAWGEKGAACGACCAVPCYALKKWLLIGSFFVLIAEKPSCLLFVCSWMSLLIKRQTLLHSRSLTLPPSSLDREDKSLSQYFLNKVLMTPRSVLISPTKANISNQPHMSMSVFVALCLCDECLYLLLCCLCWYKRKAVSEL